MCNWDLLEPKGASNEISQAFPQVVEDSSHVHPPLQNPPVHTLNSAPHLSSNQTTSPQNHSSHLHKLNLPTFSGNPLCWFTFWDSFEAAVHSNTDPGGVQKYTYLKAQLMEDASRAVTGFPLANSNTFETTFWATKQDNQSPHASSSGSSENRL